MNIHPLPQVAPTINRGAETGSICSSMTCGPNAWNPAETMSNQWFGRVRPIQGEKHTADRGRGAAMSSHKKYTRATHGAVETLRDGRGKGADGQLLVSR